MTKLVIAANRGPFSLLEARDGTVETRPGGGGLAPSIAAALELGGYDATWVATATNKAEREAARAGPVEVPDGGPRLVLLDVPAETYAAAYDVIANQTLWFWCHGLFDASRRPSFDRRWWSAWEAFREYNRAFAEAISEAADEKAQVLVNDYHLPLVGSTLKELRSDLRTVHFTHTPFPGEGEFSLLPRDVRRELVEGLSSFGACGFHTTRWAQRFDEATGGIVEDHSSFAAPLGADASRLKVVADSAECAAALRALEERVGGRRLIVRSDRMELSKNILRGFLAFDMLLSEREDLRGRVLFYARAYASREGLAEYLAYRSEVEHLVEVLNERWAGRCGGPPVVLDVNDDFPSTVAAFRRYDVLLVNPVRDGMNLVAKEGAVLNEHEGAVVLSEEAGAFEELGDVALGIQPFDVSDTAAALARALDMPAAERGRRAAELKERSAAQPPSAWLEAVLAKAR